MPFDRLSLATACLVAAVLTGACGGGDTPDTAADAEPASDAEAAPVATPAPAAGATPVTVEDIDRWQKGMAAELEAVRSASEKMKTAKTCEDTMSAMMGVQENATSEAGAKAAGLDVERYNFIRSELSAAASYLASHIGGIDTTMLSPGQRSELRQSNEAQLKQMEDRVPAEVVEALRPRAAELRTQSMELVAARLKGAGA